MADNLLAGSENLGFVQAVEAIIKRSCIIDYGVITKVESKGIVQVGIAVTTSDKDLTYITCVLANIASSAFTLDVIPEVGDKVIVLYPRMFDPDMFTVPDSQQDLKKIIIDEKASGYNLMSGIAFLFNQCKTASHKNVIKVEKGNLDVKLAYTKKNDEEKNLITLVTDKDGAVTFRSNDCTVVVNKDSELIVTNPKATAKLDKDGYLSYANTDNNDKKTKLEFTSSGMTLQDKNGCKITSTSTSVKINDKLEIKK